MKKNLVEKQIKQKLNWNKTIRDERNLVSFDTYYSVLKFYPQSGLMMADN